MPHCHCLDALTPSDGATTFKCRRIQASDCLATTCENVERPAPLACEVRHNRPRSLEAIHQKPLRPRHYLRLGFSEISAADYISTPPLSCISYRPELPFFKRATVAVSSICYPMFSSARGPIQALYFGPLQSPETPAKKGKARNLPMPHKPLKWPIRRAAPFIKPEV